MRATHLALALSLFLAAAAPAAFTQTVTPAAANVPPLRALDFAPFESALAAFKPADAADIDAFVQTATIPALQAAMAAGLPAEALALYFLGRIRSYDDGLRSYVELNPNALEEARAADKLRAAGTVLGPLHGIPVNLKDNIGTAGPMHTTVGAELLLNDVAAGDAALVRKLRAAGAVILGKANLSEFAGVVTNGPLIGGTSAVGGRTVNPHGPFPTGGSSSGSAVSTAARLTMVSVGTETSGSLLTPSSWNGVVGMKPSKGVVSGQGIAPLILNNDSAGPIGRTVTDAAILLGVIDERDTDYLAGLKVDALDGVIVGMLSQAVVAVEGNGQLWQGVAASLAAAGARLRPATLVDDPEWPGSGPFTVYLGGGVRHDMMPYIAQRHPAVRTVDDLMAYYAKDPATRIPFGSELLVSLAAGAKDLGEADFRALGARLSRAAANTLDAAFRASGAEILVSFESVHSPYYATAGYPAVTVPAGLRRRGGIAGQLGLASDGMPAGVTFIGKPGQDAQLLAYAYAFEQASNLRVAPALR